MNKHGSTVRLSNNTAGGTPTRKNINTLIYGDIIDDVKDHAKEVGIPLTRIMDKALLMYLAEYAPDSPSVNDDAVKLEVAYHHDQKMMKYKKKKKKEEEAGEA